MKRRKTTACRASVAAMLILALSACGGASIGSVVFTGGGGSGTSPVSASVSIDTFSAQGTDDNTAVSKFGTTPDTAIIDGNQNNGLFSLSLIDEANMLIDCPASNTSQRDVYDVGIYFANSGGLPGRYYLVMQACVTDRSGNASCDSWSMPILLGNCSTDLREKPLCFGTNGLSILWECNTLSQLAGHLVCRNTNLGAAARACIILFLSSDRWCNAKAWILVFITRGQQMRNAITQFTHLL